MSHTIGSPLFRRAASRRCSRRSRSFGSWLCIVLEGIVEAYTARVQYYRLTDKGLPPVMALRIAFAVQRSKDCRPRSRVELTKTEQER
jgi:hypothetical protein